MRTEQTPDACDASTKLNFENEAEIGCRSLVISMAHRFALSGCPKHFAAEKTNCRKFDDWKNSNPKLRVAHRTLSDMGSQARKIVCKICPRRYSAPSLSAAAHCVCGSEPHGAGRTHSRKSVLEWVCVVRKRVDLVRGVNLHLCRLCMACCVCRKASSTTTTSASSLWLSYVCPGVVGIAGWVHEPHCVHDTGGDTRGGGVSLRSRASLVTHTASAPWQTLLKSARPRHAAARWRLIACKMQPPVRETTQPLLLRGRRV